MQGNILLVANFASDVGYAWWLMEVLWVEIARHFSAKGRTTFLAYPAVNEIPSVVAQAPITILQHDFADRSRASRRNLRNLIRQHHITSVYLTDQRYYDILYAQLRLWGVKRIVMHDHTPGERPPVPFAKRLIKLMIHAWSVFSCDHYIGVSRFVMERFITCGMIPRQRCSYISNGIVPIEIGREWKDYAQRQFSFPINAVIVITTGRASLYKGIDFIIRCADQLVRRHNYKNVYFVHCGDGPDKDLFAQMIIERGLEQHFILAGKRSDISRLLQSCHIAMHASHGEAFSLSILEYMSAGLATLAPNMCGNGEAIENGISGALYSPGDMAEAAAILQGLVNDENKRRLFGGAARQRVTDLFTIDQMKEKFVRLISTNL